MIYAQVPIVEKTMHLKTFPFSVFFALIIITPDAFGAKEKSLPCIQIVTL